MKPDSRDPSEYFTLPLDLFTVTDLTDALGIGLTATLLGTSRRVIYTQRHNGMSVERIMQLIQHVKSNESDYRLRLVLRRKAQHQSPKDESRDRIEVESPIP